MATIKDVLGVEKIYETIKSAKSVLSKLEDNPKWEDTFEHEISEYKLTHNNVECVALQAAISSHTFLTCGNEISALPISDELLAKHIGICDSNQRNFPVKVVNSFNLPI